MFDYRRANSAFLGRIHSSGWHSPCALQPARKSQLDVRNVATSSEKGSSADGKNWETGWSWTKHGDSPDSKPLISPHESRPGFGIAQERPSKWNLARLALAGEAQIEAFTWREVLWFAINGGIPISISISISIYNDIYNYIYIIVIIFIIQIWIYIYVYMMII